MARIPSRGTKTWTVDDSVDLYGIDGWGDGFFGANDRGSLEVLSGGSRVDLKALVDELVERGIAPPILIRFSDLLRARIEAIAGAFETAIRDEGYQGAYRGVYPIKVNQNRQVVADIVRFGQPHHYGLEAGSKPELLAAMAMLTDPEALIVCNGYKDEEYVETALLASRLGPKVIMVAEKPQEVDLILSVSRRLEIAPRLGVRVRLSSRGAGHWEASGGDRSKFGLGPHDLLEMIRFLDGEGALDTFQLLHFHLGSQISSIRNVKAAIREAAWFYVHLRRMGVPLDYFDVGGGLGVDYDGSRTNFPSSMNYSLQEYANDVVYGVMAICDQGEVPHPHLVTEAGRATVAHHAVLVVEVLGSGALEIDESRRALPEGAPPSLVALQESFEQLTAKNVREQYHDAVQYRDECRQLFNLGHLSLEQRVVAEDLFFALASRAAKLARRMPSFAEELDALRLDLADTYYCNFSVFQSIPDAWAIEQLFPVVPLHRLGELPSRRAVIADVTCDSDGRLERFIDDREISPVLEVHPLGDDPYYLGIFLVGAYQEILGDLHNLFGDTNTVQVTGEGEQGYKIEQVVAGDSVAEVLRYVGYRRGEMVERIRRSTERALKDGRMTRVEARQLVESYERGLAGYTYLERD